MHKPARRSLTIFSSKRAVLSLLCCCRSSCSLRRSFAVAVGWEACRVTDAAYACPAIAHIAPDLVTDGFYRLDDPTHSIIDPVRQEAYHKSSGGEKCRPGHRRRCRRLPQHRLAAALRNVQ